MGRKLLPKTSRRQPKEIQRIRQDTKRMRKGACQDDRAKEKGNSRPQEKGETGISAQRADQAVSPQKLHRSKQRKAKSVEKFIEI